MLFPQLLRFLPLGLLFLRFMIAVIFVNSGWNDLKDPAGRAKSIGMSKSFAIFLGTAEILGGLGVLLGVFAQLASLGLILVMLGAIYKKVFAWHTGFWGENGQGWNYDLIMVAMNLIVVFTNGGEYVLMK